MNTEEKIKVLDKCIKHWEDNVKKFSVKIEDQWRWFWDHCNDSDCAACAAFDCVNCVTSEDNSCPLKSEGDGCCNGLWEAARDLADDDDLVKRDLVAILNYIKKVRNGLVKELKTPMTKKEARETLYELVFDIYDQFQKHELIEMLFEGRSGTDRFNKEVAHLWGDRQYYEEEYPEIYEALKVMKGKKNVKKSNTRKCN